MNDLLKEIVKLPYEAQKGILKQLKKLHKKGSIKFGEHKAVVYEDRIVVFLTSWDGHSPIYRRGIIGTGLRTVVGLLISYYGSEEHENLLIEIDDFSHKLENL